MLVVYDQDAPGGAVSASDAQSYAELWTAYTNQAYENSGINLRLWLVDVKGVDYNDPTPDDASSDLSLIANDQIPGVFSHRDEYHADSVVFFVPDDNGTCRGVAYIHNPIGQGSQGSSFLAMEVECSYSINTYAHELGHLLGAQHDWYVNASTTPTTYAHGHVDPLNSFTTLVAYATRCVDLGVSCLY